MTLSKTDNTSPQANTNNAPVQKHEPLRPVFSQAYLDSYGENYHYFLLHDGIDGFGGALNASSDKGRALPKIIPEVMEKIQRAYFNRDLLPTLGYHDDGRMTRSDGMESSIIIMCAIFKHMDLETLKCGFPDHSTAIFNHTPAWVIAKSCCMTYEREPGIFEPSGTFSDGLKKLKEADLITVRYRVFKDPETGEILKSLPCEIRVNADLFPMLGITSEKLKKARKNRTKANLKRAAASPGKAHTDRDGFTELMGKSKGQFPEAEKTIDVNLERFTEFREVRERVTRLHHTNKRE